MNFPFPQSQTLQFAFRKFGKSRSLNFPFEATAYPYHHPMIKTQDLLKEIETKNKSMKNARLDSLKEIAASNDVS